MKHQFYKVTGGKLAAKMNELRAAKVLFNEHMAKVVETVGATNWQQFTSGPIACLNFANPPAKEVWKKESGGYMPKRSTTEGRKIQDLINTVKTPKPYNSALSLFDLSGRMVLGKMTRQGVPMCKPQIVGKFDHGVFFIKVPVTDSEPYTATDSDMVKVKEWEMLKFMEEDSDA